MHEAPREWSWQLRQGGQGPDYVFRAHFRPGAPLAQAVEAHLPPDFVPAAGAGRYVDRHTQERLADQEARGRAENVYYYATIEVDGPELTIVNVLGAPDHGETGLLVSLARTPALGLEAWSVGYAGYAPGEVAGGVGPRSLLQYLQLA